MDGIRKSFPGNLVLDGIHLDVRPGEVHVLFGENGAGKSTLVNIISGTYAADEGEIRLDGEAIRFTSPRAARDRGINPVFQELSLVPSLSVTANVFLGRETVRGIFLSEPQMDGVVRELCGRLGFDVDPRRLVSDLSRAEQQMVEIAKALQGTPRILILDEPTTSFTGSETERLFDIVRRLRSEGLGIIYITHRMGEIREIGDRISVLRDGRCIATTNVSDVDDDTLITLMTGREALKIYPKIRFAPQQVLLELDDGTAASGRFNNISLTVRAGEIVGVAGLVGSGKSAIGRSLFGAQSLSEGRILVDGRPVFRPTPRSMLERGIVYLPPDRHRQGLVLGRPVRENATLSCLDQPGFGIGPLIHTAGERRSVRRVLERLKLHPPEIERNVSTYSGGNQQKVVFSRAFLRNTRILIVDEPTVGVDVGARLEFYSVLKDLCEAGTAILLISSDLPEILHLTHRVYVMAFGHLSAEFTGKEIEEGPILSAFFKAPRGNSTTTKGAISR
ncbi:sugar ABC transporter ATP-binding protein [Rhizobium herbae]